jgi:hypothetical protein
VLFHKLTQLASWWERPACRLFQLQQLIYFDYDFVFQRFLVKQENQLFTAALSPYPFQFAQAVLCGPSNRYRLFAAIKSPFLLPPLDFS